MLVLRREENRSTWRKPLGARTRTNNKLNPHMTPSLGIEPGSHWWEASALTTAPSVIPPAFCDLSSSLFTCLFLSVCRSVPFCRRHLSVWLSHCLCRLHVRLPVRLCVCKYTCMSPCSTNARVHMLTHNNLLEQYCSVHCDDIESMQDKRNFFAHNIEHKI